MSHKRPKLDPQANFQENHDIESNQLELKSLDLLILSPVSISGLASLALFFHTQISDFLDLTEGKMKIYAVPPQENEKLVVFVDEGEDRTLEYYTSMGK
jgi:hypothetical protein